MSFRTMKLELQTWVPELNVLHCGVRLNRSYQTLLGLHSWSFLQSEALITTTAPYVTGTATTTEGSTTVSGTTTVWTTAMINRYFRVWSDAAFYKITNVDAGLQTLTLEKAYGTASVTLGAYSIWQHHYAKPTSCKSIVDVRHNSPWRKRARTG